MDSGVHHSQQHSSSATRPASFERTMSTSLTERWAAVAPWPAKRSYRRLQAQAQGTVREYSAPAGDLSQPHRPACSRQHHPGDGLKSTSEQMSKIASKVVNSVPERPKLESTCCVQALMDALEQPAARDGAGSSRRNSRALPGRRRPSSRPQLRC